MENLINLDNRLKREVSINGIYNKKCIITIYDRDNPIAICQVTTYGDLKSRFWNRKTFTITNRPEYLLEFWQYELTNKSELEEHIREIKEDIHTQ